MTRRGDAVAATGGVIDGELPHDGGCPRAGESASANRRPGATGQRRGISLSAIKPSSLSWLPCGGTSWVASPTTSGLKSCAEQLTRDAPADGVAFLARARARATFHRFTDALTDLERAQRLGADPAVVDAEHAAIFQAVGRYDEALPILPRGCGTSSRFRFPRGAGYASC